MKLTLYYSKNRNYSEIKSLIYEYIECMQSDIFASTANKYLEQISKDLENNKLKPSDKESEDLIKLIKNFYLLKER